MISNPIHGREATNQPLFPAGSTSPKQQQPARRALQPRDRVLALARAIVELRSKAPRKRSTDELIVRMLRPRTARFRVPASVKSALQLKTLLEVRHRSEALIDPRARGSWSAGNGGRQPTEVAPGSHELVF